MRTIRNAMIPGKIRSPTVFRIAPGPSKKREPGNSPQLSKKILTIAIVSPMTGASQKMVATGWLIPERLSRKSI